MPSTRARLWVKCCLAAPELNAWSVPSSPPSPLQPVVLGKGKPTGAWIEVDIDRLVGTPRMTNLAVGSSKPSAFSRTSPNWVSSSGISSPGTESANSGSEGDRVAMKAGSMVWLLSCGWQEAQVRPLPPNVPRKKRSAPSPTSRLTKPWEMRTWVESACAGQGTRNATASRAPPMAKCVLCCIDTPPEVDRERTPAALRRCARRAAGRKRGTRVVEGARGGARLRGAGSRRGRSLRSDRMASGVGARAPARREDHPRSRAPRHTHRPEAPPTVEGRTSTYRYISTWRVRWEVETRTGEAVSLPGRPAFQPTGP